VRVGVLLQTERHAARSQYVASWMVRLSAQADDSRYLCRSAAVVSVKYFQGEHSYKEAGGLLFDR
jgi:hypothetical protein